MQWNMIESKNDLMLHFKEISEIVYFKVVFVCLLFLAVGTYFNVRFLT